jgi:hypothetical protein
MMKVLKKALQRLLVDSEAYTEGLACVGCDGEMKYDRGGNENGFGHKRSCSVIKAQAALKAAKGE